MWLYSAEVHSCAPQWKNKSSQEIMKLLLPLFPNLLQKLTAATLLQEPRSSSRHLNWLISICVLITQPILLHYKHTHIESPQCAYVHILERERQGELERKFRSGAVESGSLCHFAKREKVIEEKEGLLTQLRWITETLQSTVGAGPSCQDMGTGAEWKLSPLTLRHRGKLPVLGILQ